MRVLKSLFLLALVGAGCTDAGTSAEAGSPDSTMRSIDSSQIINNNSRLPQDSTTITVTH